MKDIERLVQDGKQAVGERRDMLISRANRLVTIDNLNTQSFTDFVGTMRGLVGDVMPDGYSNALPYNLNQGFRTDGYVEFYGGDEKAHLWVVREDRKITGSFEKNMTIQPWQELDSFSLKIPLPIGLSDIFYLDKLLNMPAQTTFSVETHPKSRGKGPNIWATIPLSETVVLGFCRKILQRLQDLPANYVFRDGELLDICQTRSSNPKEDHKNVSWRNWRSWF